VRVPVSPQAAPQPCNGPIEYDEGGPEGEAEMADKKLSQAERMEVFAALVAAQDGRMGVAQSREAVAERFGLAQEQVRRIEREGLEGTWPPLG
jgi:hypothetical protein